MLQVRKAEVKTCKFGPATVLVWLCMYREVFSPCLAHAATPQNWGVRLEEGGGLRAASSSHNDMSRLFREHRLRSVALSHKCKHLGRWCADRYYLVLPSCRKTWSNNAVVFQPDLLCRWQLPCLILDLEEMSQTELIVCHSSSLS